MGLESNGAVNALKPIAVMKYSIFYAGLTKLYPTQNFLTEYLLRILYRLSSLSNDKQKQHIVSQTQ